MEEASRDQLVRLADGNPGAATVLGALQTLPKDTRQRVFAELEALDVAGAAIWVGYKDWADLDLTAFVAGVLAHDPALLAIMGHAQAHGGEHA